MKKPLPPALAALTLLLTLTPASSQAQSPLQTEIKDQGVADFWHYDSLEAAFREARQSGKPLLVTVRCVPCKACRGMDDQVVNPVDPQLRDLMDRFVCVRLVQAWGLDLSILQFDMNMSWAAFMMNADRMIYGRYGTRAAQRNDRAITVPGFKKALEGALALHTEYKQDPEAISKQLAGKRGPQPDWRRPDDIPVIKETTRWGLPLARMTGNKNASCIHCHFVPAAEMMSLMTTSKPITDRHLWAFPLPEDIGLRLDPGQKASIMEVTAGSIAAQAGLRSGDRILELDGQPILSIADVQWVLHRADDADDIPVLIDQSGHERKLTLKLNQGWRRQGEFASRASSWDFFKVKVLGINQLEPVPETEKAKLGIPRDSTALRVLKLSPKWGGMNNDVRDAGLKEQDIIVRVDDQAAPGSHSEFLAYLVQQKRSGETLKLTVLRDGAHSSLDVPLKWNERINALRSP